MQEKPGTLEQLGGYVDGVRTFFQKGWKILILLFKMSMFLSERKKIYLSLGQLVAQPDFDRNSEACQKLLHRLERVSKKIDLDDKLIEHIRTGSRLKHDTAQ